MASGVTSKTFMWGLMGMLILGLGGFGVTNLSGNVTKVGSVGEADIDVDDYARALQDDIRAIEAQTGQALTFDQVTAFGIDRQALGRLVGEAALNNEAAQLGLSIGDKHLSDQIRQIGSFQGANGFNRESYRFALDQAGLTEAEFEEKVRAETVRTLLQGAVVTGAPMPESFADTLINYVGERRDFTWATLSDADIDLPEATPSEEDLAAYHAENAAVFTTPEMKQLTYVWLSPDDLVSGIPVDEVLIEQAYEDRKAFYVVPERRLVERLNFPDMASAEAAATALAANETTFDALVADRGLSLSDIDMGDVSKSELGQAGDAVFDAAVNQVVGPVETSLGPALFRVNGVLAGQNTPLADVRDELQAELASDAARRKIETISETVDDLLAGGATLEELEGESGMRLAKIDWHEGSEAPIAGYEAFRTAAAEVEKGDYPEVIRLEDGGIAALRMESVLEPRLQDLNEVRDAVAEGWQRQRRNRALAERAEDLAAKLKAGESMIDLGLEPQNETDVLRSDFIEAAPEGFVEAVFAMQAGDASVIRDAETVALVQINDIKGPDRDNDEVRGFVTSLSDSADAGIAEDLYAAYARAIQAEAGITIDQQALNAVHANFR